MCRTAIRSIRSTGKPLVDVPPPGPASWRTGRAVRTVVFTDIVGSTERAQEMGDRRWQEVLGRHDRLGDELAKRFRGRVMKHMGDGQLVVFETPNEAIRFAASLRSELRGVGLDVRAGCCTPVKSIFNDGTWPGSASTSPLA
jgi:class 3 adenylate cyclase